MILKRLRAETTPFHERIEATVDIGGRLRSMDTYSELLGRFLGFYDPLEAQLQTVDGLLAIGLDLKPRRKTAWLRQDLLACGYSREAIDRLPNCQRLPRTDDLASALGVLYVMEGSTLGGNYIRKEVKRVHGFEPGTGCSFFSSYQGEVGSMWNEFCSVLTSYTSVHPETEDAIVSAASETFTTFEAWVGEGRRL